MIVDLDLKVVRPARLELATFWFVARRSIQLSYGRSEGTLLILPLRAKAPPAAIQISYSDDVVLRSRPYGIRFQMRSWTK
jgi:hypothetical protein